MDVRGIYRIEGESIMCPYCKGNNVVDIYYGIPFQYHLEAERNGELRYGGHTRHEDSFDKFCKDCKIGYKEKEDE